MYSLRRTLAVRFSLTIFVALLFIALWAYLGTRRVLRQELDNDLSAALELESAPLIIGRPLSVQHGYWALPDFIEHVNRFVVIRDSAGQVIGTNTPLARDLPLEPEVFAAARGGARAWTTGQWHGRRIRTAYGPPPDGAPGRVAAIQVAAFLEPHDAASRRVLFVMLGTVLLGTVATALGAGWLAGSAVAPVEAITAQANAVKPGTTGQRITAHADVLEYHGLIQVLNEMLERLDRGLDLERRIIADVGHDLRTPLTAMRGELEIALRSERNAATYRSVLVSMFEEVERLSSISEALVLLARLEAGELIPERNLVDVGELVQGAVSRAKSRADGRQITLRGAEDEVRARVDDNMLSVVIDHLLDNALQHTPTGTRIEVGLETGDATLAITVDDDGPGIPDRDLPHIFERLYRADAARSRSTGAGLGLTIAAAITNAHGGSIRAERSALGGLRIVLELPRNV